MLTNEYTALIKMPGNAQTIPVTVNAIHSNQAKQIIESMYTGATFANHPSLVR